MSRKKPTAPTSPQRPQPQTKRDGWINAFSDELRRLRPQLTPRVLWTIGLELYVPDSEPKTAARAYHEAQGPCAGE